MTARGLLLILLALGAVRPALAQQAETALRTPHYRVDAATLRRGAALFAGYCQACHSMSRIRYGRFEHDLGMSDAELIKTFPSAANGVTQGIVSPMKPADAARAFGVAPPDLSLEARYRGTDWIYSYLEGFYQDTRRPTGWNNHVFPNVAMPDVLADLQGTLDADGKVISKGSATPEQFDRDVNDLTAWLQYASDPSELARHADGPWVIGFTGVFTVLAYALKRVVWRRVH